MVVMSDYVSKLSSFSPHPLPIGEEDAIGGDDHHRGSVVSDDEHGARGVFQVSGRTHIHPLSLSVALL